MNMLSALRTYKIISFCYQFFLFMMLAINLYYQVTIVGLDPFQLVLLGTFHELSIFLCEVPTGILADLKSRKLSVVIGFVLVGIGFMIQGSFPVFGMILLGQVFWGIGSTFLSGALEAWIADESLNQNVTSVYLTGSRLENLGGLLGIPGGILIALYSVPLAIMVGGFFISLLGLALIFIMPERHFTPHAHSAGERIQGAFNNLSKVRRLQKVNGLIAVILLLAFFYGFASEGYDRLWAAQVIRNIGFPSLFPGMSDVAWFGAIAFFSKLISLGSVSLAQRYLKHRQEMALVNLLWLVTGILCLCIVGFAFSHVFFLALIFLWSARAIQAVIRPLFNGWVNLQIKDSSIRATTFSVLSQSGALGEIFGGPGVGWIGRVISIPAALITSSLFLIPNLFFYYFGKYKFIVHKIKVTHL